MENKESNKVDWANIIIFKYFQNYLNLDEVIDLSMLSKFTRSKLKPSLFKNIRLFTKDKRYGCIPVRVYNVKSFEELSKIAICNEDELKENSDIKKSLSDIKSELQDIRCYNNSVFIKEVERSVNYLYPIFSKFENLTILKIHCSTIQYSMFQKLGEYFSMLNTLELHGVILLKASTDRVNSNEVFFPFNLRYLSILRVEWADICTLHKPYTDFIDYNFDFRSKFAIPNLSLPSLKKLQFIRCSVNNNGLEEFLKTNPNLEQLTIDTFIRSMGRYFNSLKSLHVDLLDKVNNLENLITHQNIKTLKISIENSSYYENFEKLCLMCPSVEYLYLNVLDARSYQGTIDTCLVPISKKLLNLKTIELPISCLYNHLIDINHLSKIEKIIFETEGRLNLNVNFEKNINLKEIEFKDTYRDINKEEFLEKYKIYKEWKFKFYKRKVIGYKI